MDPSIVKTHADKRTQPIAIIPPSCISKQNNSLEYSLNNNCFDPTNNTPPDIFMDKLEKRMKNYYSTLSLK